MNSFSHFELAWISHFVLVLIWGGQLQTYTSLQTLDSLTLLPRYINRNCVSGCEPQQLGVQITAVFVQNALKCDTVTLHSTSCNTPRAVRPLVNFGQIKSHLALGIQLISGINIGCKFSLGTTRLLLLFFFYKYDFLLSYLFILFPFLLFN